MKGIIIVKPLEYNLEAMGEKWRQGEKIKGTLKIKNHGTEVVTLPFLKIALESGNYKKVKAKDQKAWEELSKNLLAENISIPAGASIEFPWEFLIAEDCRITDKDGSVYLTYFSSDEAWPTGNIELVIEPKILLLQFLEVFENFLRFKVQARKFSKGMVEFKMTAPKSRDFGHVDSLTLRMKEVQKELFLEYHFIVSVLAVVDSNMIASKKTNIVEQKLNSKQYSIYGDSINQDFVVSSIQSVLNEIKPKIQY